MSFNFILPLIMVSIMVSCAEKVPQDDYGLTKIEIGYGRGYSR